MVYEPPASRSQLILDDLNDLPKAQDAADNSAEDLPFTAKYDLHDISPREIDQLVKELRQRGMISDQQMMTMLSWGAEYLSNQPDTTPSGTVLDQKIDLIGKLEQLIEQEKHGQNPVEAHKKVLEFLREQEVRSHMPVAGFFA